MLINYQSSDSKFFSIYKKAVMVLVVKDLPKEVLIKEICKNIRYKRNYAVEAILRVHVLM